MPDTFIWFLMKGKTYISKKGFFSGLFRRSISLYAVLIGVLPQQLLSCGYGFLIFVDTLTAKADGILR
jgi:hypothetical protein